MVGGSCLLPKTSSLQPPKRKSPFLTTNFHVYTATATVPVLNVNYISPLTTIRLPQKTNRVKKGDKAFITLKKQGLDKGMVVGLGFLK